MAVALASISPTVIPSNGGYALVITGTFDLETAYHVHLGSDAAALICHAGPEKTNEVFSLDGTTILCYAPEGTAGDATDVYVEESVTPATNDTLPEALILIDRDYSTSLWAMKSLFPPNRPMGPRSIAHLPAPNEPKNLLRHTEQFLESVWQTNAMTVVPGAITAPLPGTGAILHEDATASDVHELKQASIPSIANTVFVWSCFAKAINRDFLGIQAGGEDWFVEQVFDLASGILGEGIASGSPIVSVDIRDVAHLGESGWYRIHVTVREVSAVITTLNLTLRPGTGPDVADQTYDGLDQDSVQIAFPAVDIWSLPRMYRLTTAEAIT